MKISQSDNQITIKQGGAGQVIAGVAFIIIGIILAVVLFSNKKSSPALGLIGIVLAAVGALLMAVAEKKQTTIQKGGDTSITATRMIGGKTATQSFPTATLPVSGSTRIWT